jgi:hypothetical protein
MREWRYSFTKTNSEIEYRGEVRFMPRPSYPAHRKELSGELRIKSRVGPMLEALE